MKKAASRWSKDNVVFRDRSADSYRILVAVVPDGGIGEQWAGCHGQKNQQCNLFHFAPFASTCSLMQQLLCWRQQRY
jgi:hypothetical protein